MDIMKVEANMELPWDLPPKQGEDFFDFVVRWFENQISKFDLTIDILKEGNDLDDSKINQVIEEFEKDKIRYQEMIDYYNDEDVRKELRSKRDATGKLGNSV